MGITGSSAVHRGGGSRTMIPRLLAGFDVSPSASSNARASFWLPIARRQNRTSRPTPMLRHLDRLSVDDTPTNSTTAISRTIAMQGNHAHRRHARSGTNPTGESNVSNRKEVSTYDNWINSLTRNQPRTWCCADTGIGPGYVADPAPDCAAHDDSIRQCRSTDLYAGQCWLA